MTEGDAVPVGALERLVAAEEIRQLKARYFRLMDYKVWDEFRELFAHDAVMDMSEAGSNPGETDFVSHGPDAITDFIRRVLDGVTTVHHGHMPEIEVLSATTASGLWAMEDELWYPESSEWSWAQGYGTYHETYVVQDGRWCIQAIRLVRLKVVNAAR